MRLTLMRCLLLNLVVIGASGALFKWFPTQLGFTVTTARATHYVGGNIVLSGILLCLMDSAITIYLAWSLLNPR